MTTTPLKCPCGRHVPRVRRDWHTPVCFGCLSITAGEADMFGRMHTAAVLLATGDDVDYVSAVHDLCRAVTP
jgi:hypothetical protein